MKIFCFILYNKKAIYGTQIALIFKWILHLCSWNSLPKAIFQQVLFRSNEIFNIYSVSPVTDNHGNTLQVKSKFLLPISYCVCKSININFGGSWSYLGVHVRFLTNDILLHLLVKLILDIRILASWLKICAVHVE